ncbi:MAG: hypothetical protein EB157_04145, partial [Euryarchaeota archaeon]|nr:hypothetical protein [Euryarchaeota archaeon]
TVFQLRRLLENLKEWLMLTELLKTIELKIPPAWDPTPEKRGTRGQDDETLNDYISGSYLVSAIVHNFAEEYYSEVKVKRDSTPTNPFTS